MRIMHAGCLAIIAALLTTCGRPDVKVDTTLVAIKPSAEQPRADSALAAASESQEHGAVTHTSNASFRQVEHIPELIACDPAQRTSCFADRTLRQDECCTGDVVADWILVTPRSDSLQLFVGPGSGLRRDDASITMQQIGRGRAFQEHDVNTASYLRYRFPEAGAYTLHVGVRPGYADGDTVAYELRVRQAANGGALKGAPLVFLDADSLARLAIVPNRAAAAAPDGLAAFEVRPGWYRVLAPGLDSVFACRLPCTSVQAVAAGTSEQHVRF